jgi:distribution and morphology protein 31
VSRRPGQGHAKVQKGSQAAAAAAANVERPEDVTNINIKDDGNYTQFDVTVDTVNVTLSFTKWFNGKGLLQNVEMKGIRGVIDRTHVKHTTEYVDPKSYKHEHKTGDFELDSFKMEDLLVTVYQPDSFRPFQISIFACDMPRLRQQWLFYDFISANNISGSIDNSLFTLHPRQTQNYTDAKLGTITIEGEMGWKKQTRLRIDGLNIDHLNRGVEGPFSWIREGNVDIIADIMFPNEDDDSVAKVISDVIDRVEATVTTNSIPPVKKPDPEPNAVQAMQSISEGGTHVPEQPIPAQPLEGERYLVMDIKVHLNGVRAAVPLFTKDISYVNNALIRPIVAYINTKKTFIPINMRVCKERDEFDGSWTLFDSGLLDDLNKEVS